MQFRVVEERSLFESLAFQTSPLVPGSGRHQTPIADLCETEMQFRLVESAGSLALQSSRFA